MRKPVHGRQRGFDEAIEPLDGRQLRTLEEAAGVSESARRIDRHLAEAARGDPDHIASWLIGENVAIINGGDDAQVFPDC